MELLQTNIKSKNISDCILIFGSCIQQEYPQILKRFRQKTKLYVCLEKEHVDKVAWKILSIARVNATKEIAVLTIDGSPHCVQLHYAVEDVIKNLPSIKAKHFVIEGGKLFEISSKATRKSRHLKEIEDAGNGA